MTGQRWQQLKDVLQAAWAMDAGDRAAFLDQIHAQDPKLHTDVEALLVSDQNIGEFLAAPAIHLPWDLETDDSGDDWLGQRVGSYRILREIGHGGMGTVYLAERADGQYQKQVAIKLVNSPHGDRHFLRRFLRERQVLAGLEHPNVVRLLDGGATENGLPYLVLEHVEGVRIDTWCETRKIAVRDCVRLFRNVCAAVEYAHRNEVIHLDIKPGNILVTADGVPKLLDFGVARVLNPERSAEITETSPGRRPMTPEYASPEQARGEPVGRATDIYALGLVLYRLLTGHLPLMPGTAAVTRELDGDLDSIVRKALNPAPGGRYASVAEFSDDLDRFLNDRPVRARKTNLVYYGRKLVRRNRLAASLISAVLAVSMLVLAVLRARSTAHKSNIVAHSPKLLPSQETAPGTKATAVPARILERPAPRDTAPKPKSGTALTVNPEALKAYEEGIDHRAHFRGRDARNALRRAIDLDPEFVMAHYQLADSMRFDGDVTGARRSIARALQLAEHAPLPRLHRMLAQALQMRLDFRLEEAGKILEAAHREFPREIEPLFQLAGIRSGCARFAEAATLLETIIGMDERHALAHDQLGYQYAFLGDLGRAVASIDRYAALVPPGNEVPYCSRGDVYMINAHYDEALEQYRKINYRGPMAVAALHAGAYGFVESLLQGRRKANTYWFGILGDQAAARGQLDQAAPYYEQAIPQYEVDGPLRAWFGLLSAARIYLEQFRPEEVLALGRRHVHPWAAGLRGTAHLLLHQEADAEREFTALRQSIMPILGDYVAAGTVEFHRMLAASYAGRFDRVIETWPRLPHSWWSLYALDVGRAYLHSGVFTEAEYHLQLARKAQQAYFMNGDMMAQHNLLTWMLADFYLGQMLEKTGRRGEAIAQYRDFVKHFENSTAALPQLAAAREILSRLGLSERGKLLFSDGFSGNGNWQIDHGDREWMVRRLTPYHDAIFELSFRIDAAGEVTMRLGSEQSNLALVSLNSRRILLTALQPDESGGLRLGKLDNLVRQIEPGTLHKVVVEVRGKRILVQLDDKLIVSGESPGLDVDKTKIGLAATNASASFDYMRMYEVASK